MKERHGLQGMQPGVSIHCKERRVDLVAESIQSRGALINTGLLSTGEVGGAGDAAGF